MPEEIAQLNERIKRLENIIGSLVYSDRLVLSKDMQFMDGRNIQAATATGTKIGTATNQKLSVFGVTPVIQAGAITSPSGGGTQDSQARTAIDAIRVALLNFGITA